MTARDALNCCIRKGQPRRGAEELCFVAPHGKGAAQQGTLASEIGFV
jgi:hypothetical protein